MQIGIVGLPLSGKTTFFQTLTETHLDTDALRKKDANIAIVKVPDERLDKLTKIFQPKKQINATIEIVDIAGIHKSEQVKSSFSSSFLSKIKPNDALIHVVRAFYDEGILHSEGSVDMIRDIQMLEEELILSDMSQIENRMEKLHKELKKQNAPDTIHKEKEILENWLNTLQNGIPIRSLELTSEEIKIVKNFQPLSAKPMLIALNFSDNDIANSEELTVKVRNSIQGKSIAIEPFFAKIEMELAVLPDEDKELFMNEYGIKESALSRLIRSAYNLLGLQSFFTVGEDECRAWTIKKGMNAQESAGVIHTDFYNKFIRAEVVSFKDFMECGSFAKCKEKGLFRLEGKDYIVKDGDILHVRHS